MRFLSAITLTLLFLGCILTSCRENAPHPKPPVEVITLKIEPANIPAVFEYVGFTKSSHLVEIRARVEGYLDKIAYKEGDLVKENDLLFQLDPKPFVASLDSALGALSRQKAVLWNAEQTLARYKPLYEQKAASLRDLDDSIAAQLSADASVIIAEANVVQAKLNLGYTSIQSPIRGLSAQSTYREGTLITPNANGLLTTISVIDPMWVLFSVSDNELLNYRKQIAANQLVFPKDLNFDVQIVLGDNTTFPQLGKVNFASPSIDKETGTMTVRAIFPNPNNSLKPGQFVRVRVLGAERLNTIVVPQKAVLQGKNGMFVYVVDKEGKVAMHTVDVGSWYGNNWIINEGLMAGDEVIVDGVNKVVVGAPVKVIPQPGKGTSPDIKS